jgi:hypothetical protein
MKRSNRAVLIGVIALVAIIVLTLIAAPSTKNNSGSTYSRAANGYGAWYAFMQQQGISIQRWQKPVSELATQKTPVTLLQINSNLQSPELYGVEKEWVEKGNILVILGVTDKVTAAEFSTLQKSDFGDVKIETRRRHQPTKEEKFNLGDRFGAIVWEAKYNSGKVIFVTTRHLAANAYQDYLSNFKFLADLVTKTGKKVFVDEYIHGYKDTEVRKKEGKGNIWSYLSKTPVFPILIQTIILLLVLIWAQNRRFGKAVILEKPTIDNSEAYIQALAGVLQKAESTDFVVEMLGREEQLQLQQALGLGQTLLERQVLINVWQEKIGVNTAELDTLLQSHLQKKLMSERNLISWLGKWKTLREIKHQ